jgi:phosphate transport system permease protein
MDERNSQLQPELILASSQPRTLASRLRLARWFYFLCLGTATFAVLILVLLLVAILVQGLPWLTWQRLSGDPSPIAEEAGIRPALWGTVWVCTLCAMIGLPIGVGTAILLEEFQAKSRWGRWLQSLVQLNISNLAGVPSVVYGLLGLTVFVSMFGLWGSGANARSLEFGVRYFDQYRTEGKRIVLLPVASQDAPPAELASGMQGYSGDMQPVTIQVWQPGQARPTDKDQLAYTVRAGRQPGRVPQKSWYYFRLPFGRSVLAGALTLILVVLPIVIIASQEALRSVPNSLRDGALGLGATRWQVVRNVTLPAALPGIMTGSILAMSRAIGEAAPVLIIAGVIYISRSPQNLMDDFTVMPLQIYDWASRPQESFHHVAAAGIIILLLVLLIFNAVAVFIRQRVQKSLQ